MINYEVIERTIDYFGLLHSINLMTHQQVIEKLDEKILDKLIDIYSIEKHYSQFGRHILSIVNSRDFIEGWDKIPESTFDFLDLDKYLFEQYLIPTGIKICNAYCEHKLDNTRALRLVGISCLFMEIERLFAEYEMKNQVPIELKQKCFYYSEVQNRYIEKELPKLIYILFPSTIDAMNMISKPFN